MTEEEFIRNNRKINDGKDLPREMLTALYHSIAKDEIRVSSDPLPPASPRGSSSGGGPHSRSTPTYGARTPGVDGHGLGTWGPASEMTSSRWVDIVKRGPQSLPYVCCADPRPLLDHDVFASLAGPALAAMVVVFDHSEEEAVLQMCLRGFSDASKVCAAHCMRDVLDDLVVSLCRFTALIHHSAGSSSMPRSSSGGTPKGVSPSLSGGGSSGVGSRLQGAFLTSELPGGPYSEEETAAIIFADDHKTLPSASLVFSVATRYGMARRHRLRARAAPPLPAAPARARGSARVCGA